MISQGDQYNIPIQVYANNEAITPEDVDDVRIQVGCQLKEYSKGEITFDNGYWNYPLTEEQSRQVCNGQIKVQVAIKVGMDYIYSSTQLVVVNNSIIEESWQ